MKRDGPETLNFTERLRATRAEELKAREDVIRQELNALAESLRQSSTAALKQTKTDFSAQITGIETEVTAHVTRIRNAMSEIQSEPARLMRRSALIGAVIGGLMTLIPWAGMSYLGMSVTGEAGSYFEQIRRIRDEEARINALESVEIIRIGSDKVLMLPASATQIFQCGDDRTPCILLEE